MSCALSGRQPLRSSAEMTMNMPASAIRSLAGRGSTTETASIEGRMNDATKTKLTTEAELDEIARLLDEANLIFHGFSGVISRWTAGSEQLYGWSRQEAVGRVVHELLATT